VNLKKPTHITASSSSIARGTTERPNNDTNRVKTGGYGRSYLSWLLRSYGKKVRVNGKIVVVADVRK
jgi:hypothetical protein